MEQKFGINELNVLGSYAGYNAAMNISIASFNVHDVAAAVQIALQADGLRQQVGDAMAAIEKNNRDHTAEVNGMQEKLTDAEIRVKEARNGVLNAEAHSVELSKSLQSVRAELSDVTDLKDKFKSLSTFHFDNVEFVRRQLNVGEDVGDEQFREVVELAIKNMRETAQNQAKAAVYWYDALQKVHEAVGGDKVIDSDGLGDDEFVRVLCDQVSALRNAAESKRDDTTMITLRSILNILAIEPGYKTEAVMTMVRGIKERSDAYNNQACEWQRNYNELCNVLGIESTIPLAVIEEAKKALASREKQENYQRKYNQLKGALGLAGMPHDEAVRLAEANPVR